ncbi:MAG: hypothetical protein K0R02_43 [Rickettsiaceae bacterium]|jgi:hypothetical protein|nr:hypothetical protein [Rickettsiaceae bacterium]
MKQKEPFLQLELKKFKLKNDVDNIYYVYTDKDNFSEVTASSAGEAIEKSQIQEPFMVLHYDVKSKPHFVKDDLEEVAQEALPSVSEVPQKAPDAKAPEAPTVEGAAQAEDLVKTEDSVKAPEEKPQESAKTEEPTTAIEPSVGQENKL